MSPLELRWGGTARVVGLGLLLALIAVTAWASVHPDTSTWTVGVAAALTLALLAQVVAMLALRVRVDDKLLIRRTLRGTDVLAWDDIAAALLVATEVRAGAIAHRHTLAPADASHVLLYPRGGGRRWHFHAWMTDFPQLVAAVHARGLVTLERPDMRSPSRGEQRVDRLVGTLGRFNAIGASLVHWYILAFVLFFASLSVIAGLDVEISGNIIVDLAVFALVPLGAVALLSRALRAIGARTHAHALAPVSAAWPLDAASLIGGVLLIVGFRQRALAGTHDHPWLDVFFVVLGVFLIYMPLRGWLRGE